MKEALLNIWRGKQKAWVAAAAGYLVALATQFFTGAEVEPGVIEAFTLETSDLFTSLFGAIATGLPAYLKGNWPKEPSASGRIDHTSYNLRSPSAAGVAVLAALLLSACALVPPPPAGGEPPVVTDRQIRRCDATQIAVDTAIDRGAQIDVINALKWAEYYACSAEVLAEMKRQGIGRLGSPA